MSIFTSKNTEQTPPWKACFNILLLSALLLLCFWGALSAIQIQFDFSFLSAFRLRLWDGFMATVLISVCSLVLSLIFGLCAAVMQSSRFLLPRYFAKLYVVFIRGTPLIMQIYLFFYIVGTALGIESRFLSGVIILSVFEGAYISEILRGSFLSLDATQLEAAKAVGLTRGQSFRYVLFPQLLARTLPALTGQFASIIKDSSLLSMIAVIELTQTMREISATNLKLFECYFVLGLMYLALTLPISLLSKWIERKFSYENRA